MLMVVMEKRHSLFQPGRTSSFTCPAFIIIVCRVDVPLGMDLTGSCSAVLEGPSQVHAREVPW